MYPNSRLCIFFVASCLVSSVSEKFIIFKSKLNLRHLKPQGSNIFWKSEECSSLRLTLTVDIAEVVTELQPVRCIAKKTVNRSIRLQHYLQIVRLYKCIKVKMKSKVVPTYA